ncbi:MAG: ABC-three component system middle component 2 [Christensenellales bacterium]
MNCLTPRFETSLRVLLTLRVFGEAMTLDKIAAADFMTIYARDFGLAAYNLNGDNSLSFSEAASKRATCRQGA